jgi:hypothetical protein
MTTNRERQCLDLIFAALDGMVPHDDEREANIRKLFFVLGIAAHLTVDAGLDEDDVIEALQNRISDYEREVPT